MNRKKRFSKKNLYRSAKKPYQPEFCYEPHPSWARDPVAPAEIAGEIEFQLIDIDHCTRTIDGHRSDVLRLFGATMSGASVSLEVHGFKPYFYVYANPLPSAEAIQRQIGSTSAQLLDGLEIDVVDRTSIYYYRPGHAKFMRISSPLSKNLRDVQNCIRRTMTHCDLFDCGLPFPLRYMLDKQMVGCGWVGVAPGCVRASEATGTSNCQIELVAQHGETVKAVKNKDEVAPLRILSFDIECYSRPGVFPVANMDSVIQIGNVVLRQGETEPFISNVFVLGTCNNFDSAVRVHSFENEGDMLLAWSQFVVCVDPDVIIGYNHQNFDFTYLLDRAEHLGLKRFSCFSRLRHAVCQHKPSTFSSKAYGAREQEMTTVRGRLVLDVMLSVMRNHKLRQYTLNSVAQHFLKDQKNDMPYEKIPLLHDGTAADRALLAHYCYKDALLPLQIIQKLQTLLLDIEMARTTNVPIDYLLKRGQQIKVVAQLTAASFEFGYLLPLMEVDHSDGVKYDGATVLDPVCGYYIDPVTTLDFASLYPSIMMAHNLCYTTLLDPSEPLPAGLDPEKDITVTPLGAKFVKAHVKRGLLPQILENLLTARKGAKKAMREAKDPFKRGVMNGRQLALKISANSVYGFTGATVGKLPCLEISASVTAYGRQMIDATKEKIESYFTRANGYDNDAQVIYGDTDSVMIRFFESMERSMELGKLAADIVTKSCFLPPIKLEFEKAYLPYLLMKKKRYAGLLWTSPEKHDYLDAKGLETVRRDNCLLASETMQRCLDLLLLERDPRAAEQYVRKVVSRLHNNEVSISLLIITKSYSRKPHEYANKQSHIMLAERMKKRPGARVYNLGDRVAYVVARKEKNAKMFDKAEDPLYVIENDIPIDVNYYIENQLRKPLTRIFEPIVANCNSLFVGEHTRRLVRPTPTESVGGIMKFVRKRVVCLHCRVPLPREKGNDPLCAHCSESTAEIYVQEQQKVAKLEGEYSRIWINCQTCQSERHKEIFCSNSACHFFYMRAKTNRDLKAAQKRLSRFEINDW